MLVLFPRLCSLHYIGHLIDNQVLLQMVTAAMKLQDACSLEEKL